MSNQTKNNDLNYLVDQTYINVKFSFENETDRTYFSSYYVPKVEIKYFNVLVDGKQYILKFL